jgi:hypothetical protein
MNLRPIQLVTLLALGLVASACSRQVPLQNPASIAAPAPPDAQRAAIFAGAQRRGWTIVGEVPGQIDAALQVRRHEVRVRILYDGMAIHVQYVSSANLNFAVGGDGVAYIHPSYERWATQLAEDIYAQLVALGGAQTMQVQVVPQQAPPAVAPAPATPSPFVTGP